MSGADATGETEGVAERVRGLPLGLALLIGGLAWWPVAFLPWLLGPGGAASIADRLRTPVPLLAGSAPSLITCVLVGGLLSGWLLRLCRGALLARILLGLFGLLVTMGLTSALSVAGSRRLATDSISQSRSVSYGLIAILVVLTGLAWLIGLLGAYGSSAWVVPAAAVATLAVGWLSQLSGRDLSLGGWPFAVLLGLALGIAAYRRVLALVWWVPALVLAWLTTSAVTAAVYSQQLIPGLSRRADLLQELVSEVVVPCLQVFGMASLPQNRVLLPWAVALGLGLLGLILGRFRPRPRSVEKTPSGEAGPASEWPVSESRPRP